MDSFFFRVEHDLLRSESFKTLGGSAIKVYLVIGLYSDFGTGWAYPSIRTIARQAGLSRQTVLAAIEDLARAGPAGDEQVEGPVDRLQDHPPGAGATGPEEEGHGVPGTGPDWPTFFRGGRRNCPNFFRTHPPNWSRFFRGLGPIPRPERPRGLGPNENQEREKTAPASRFRELPSGSRPKGGLLVAVDLQELLTDQGIPRRLAERLAAQKDPEDVAKVLLNAFYLQSQGKLQNGPGYIRAGIEDGYDLLPQVANRLESRRRELEAQLRTLESKREKARQEEAREAENAAIALVIESLRPGEVDELVRQAVALAPRADRPPEPDAQQPVRPGQGLRAGGRRAALLIVSSTRAYERRSGREPGPASARRAGLGGRAAGDRTRPSGN